MDTEIRWYSLPSEVSPLSKKKRNLYPREFKLEAVRLALDKDMSAAQVVRDLGIHQEFLFRWKREFKNDPAFAFPGQGKMFGDQAELKRLQKRIKELEEERELQKNAWLLREGREVRFGFIEDNRSRFTVSRMCDLLSVSMSGYNAWRARPESARRHEERRLLSLIRTIHQESRGYGSPCVWRELRYWRERCGLNRVTRLMRQEGLQSAYLRKWRQ